MRILLLLAALSMLGCETTAPVKDSTSPAQGAAKKAVQPADEIHVEKKREEYTLTGRNVFLAVGRQRSKNCFSANELNALKEETAALLKKQGFTVVGQARKGHSTLALLCDEFSAVTDKVRKLMIEAAQADVDSAIDPNSSVETTETISSYKDGKFTTETKKYISGTWRRFAYAWVIHEYGRRERTAFTIGLSVAANQWNAVKSKVGKRALEELESMDLKAPDDNLKMAGDPACQPRFGFLAPPQIQEGNTVHIVSEVLPGSPAKAAGMRIGDVLLAVDSEEYSDKSIPESLYNVKTPVPLKLARNGKIIRSSIAPKIICP